MKRILIVGTALSALRKYLEENGYDHTVLKDVLLTKFPDKKFKKRVVCDFSSKESILSVVDSIKKPIDGVIATYENYILPASWIAEHLGVPGLPVSAAEACTDKFLMRSLFANAPEKISPDFAIVENKQQLIDFANSHNFPLILKPANLAKSLLVTKNHNLEELERNYSQALLDIERIYKKYAPHRQPKLIIEEFLEGSIHSVDAFVDSEGTPYVLDEIVDYQTGYDIGFDDNFHYSRILPSKLSDADKLALKHCAELGVRALDIKNSPAHIEIIMTASGPRIVEIGARNGGYRDRMHKLANGIDIYKNTLHLALGEKPHIKAERNDPIAVLELFPKSPGKFQGIANHEQLLSLQSLTYLDIKAKDGAFIGKSSQGYKMAAVIMLHNSDCDQFNKDLDFVNTQVGIVTN